MPTSHAPIDFEKLPGRILLDTCVLNALQDEDEYLFEGILPNGCDSESEVDVDMQALRRIMAINERASFQFVVSPLSVTEIVNQQSFESIWSRLRWLIDVLDVWLIMLDESDARKSQGGDVAHRFKLSPSLQALEGRLMVIPDFRKDPIDRLLLVHAAMAQCDAFMTTDQKTVWKHREQLRREGIIVITPAEYWAMLEPWAGIWK